MANKTEEKERPSNPLYEKLEDSMKQNEARLVSCLWKNPDYFYYDFDLKYEDFVDNRWGTLFFIGNDLICNHQVKEITEQEIDTYLKNHKKIKKVWDSFANIEESSYARIMNIAQHMSASNIEYYVEEFKKMNIIKQLIKKNLLLLTEDNLKKFLDMSLDEIYMDYEIRLNDVFSKGVMQVKSYNIYDNIQKNREEWEQGLALGMDFLYLPNFSDKIGGIPMGGVTLLGGVSNSGKSSLLRNSVFPQLCLSDAELIKFKESEENGEDFNTDKKTVIFLNEEDISKWQREFLTYIINKRLDKKKYNIPTGGFNKTVLRDGNFEKDYKELLDIATERMMEITPEDHILFIPLPKFSTQHTIKQIKKYAMLGYKNFIIDTFKMDNVDDAKIDNNTRLQLVQNMTHLYNVAKKEGGKNVRVICTVQLTKAVSYKRFLSQDALAESKNIIDVCSLGVFIRKVWEDEKKGGSHELEVRSYIKDSKGEAPILELTPSEEYLILFPVKTREGQVGTQSICRVDWARNIVEEIGFTQVQMDN